MKIQLNRRKVAVLSLVILALVGAYHCGRAQAQNGQWETDYFLSRGMSSGPSATSEEKAAYSRVLQNAIGNKQRTQIIASTNATGEDSEMQAVELMQNQKLIEQNARMIQLLEAQAKKK